MRESEEKIRGGYNKYHFWKFENLEGGLRPSLVSIAGVSDHGWMNPSPNEMWEYMVYFIQIRIIGKWYKWTETTSSSKNQQHSHYFERETRGQHYQKS